jgi:hypothetical protein
MEGAMTEPRTAAGRALWNHLTVAGRPSVERIAEAILAIEAEAAQPDEEPEGHEHQGHETIYRAETCPVCHPRAARSVLLTREALLRDALERIAYMTSRAPHRSLPIFAIASEALAALPSAVPEPTE